MNDSGRDQLAAAADRAAADLEAARTHLAQVTRATHDGSGASSRVILEQFRTAVGALAKPGGKVSQAEAAALAKVFCDLELLPVNAGQWAGRCFMRLPLADGSVLRCAPWSGMSPFRSLRTPAASPSLSAQMATSRGNGTGPVRGCRTAVSSSNRHG